MLVCYCHIVDLACVLSASAQSTYQEKSRGVAILIHKSVHFLSSNVIPNRRYILVSMQLYNTPVVNVYGPNWDNEAFFQLMFSKLPNLSTNKLILGGDFNCCLNTVAHHLVLLYLQNLLK